jgi:hypothetical protein
LEKGTVLPIALSRGTEGWKALEDPSIENRALIMGRGRNRKGNSSSRHESILTEASKLKQQAERKSNGPERVPLLEKCSQLFQNALQFPLSLRDKEEALFDLAEC